MNEKSLRTGKYRHYKGNEYLVLGTATHSETGEALVVYQPLYGESHLWARPLSMFLEFGEFNGQNQDRFRFLESEVSPIPLKIS